MEKEFVPYELALELKQLGFENPNPIGGYRGGAVFYYDKSSELFYDGLPMYSSSYHRDMIIAPTYSQAFRWFREKHNMNHSIILHETTFSNDYQYLVLSNDNEFVEVGYTTYEEAELVCLQKLIEIVKTK